MKPATKVLSTIFGILMVIVGLYCMFTPVDTYMVIGWAVGISMLADAIGRFAIWWAARKLHISDSWMLFAAIFSLVCGVLVLSYPALQNDINLFIAYYIAAWLVAQGIVTIVRAWKVRELHVSLNTQMVGTHWYVPFIIGILLIVLGVLSCMNPNIIAASIGLFIGLGIAISGANIIAIATVLPTIGIVEVEE